MAQTLLQHPLLPLLIDNEAEEAASAADVALVWVAAGAPVVEDNWKMFAAADVRNQKGTVCLSRWAGVESWVAKPDSEVADELPAEYT